MMDRYYYEQLAERFGTMHEELCTLTDDADDLGAGYAAKALAACEAVWNLYLAADRLARQEARNEAAS
jgi:hypothetical protein